MTSATEQAAIAAYKQAAQKLPCYSYLEDYALPDFTRTVHGVSNTFDALQTYLREAEVYTGNLTRAASARQNHYEQFILTKRPEDRGHRIWRQGLNLLARDAHRKVRKWQNVREDLFDQLVEESTSPALCVPDAEYSELPVVPAKENTLAPPLSPAEKRRRKRVRAKARARKEKEEAALLEQFRIPQHGEVRIPQVRNLSELVAAGPAELIFLIHPVWFFIPVSIEASEVEKKSAVSTFFQRQLSASETLLYSVLCRDTAFATRAGKLLFPRLTDMDSIAAHLQLVSPVWLAGVPCATYSSPITDVFMGAYLLDQAEIALIETMQTISLQRSIPTTLYLQRCVADFWTKVKTRIQPALENEVAKAAFGKKVLSRIEEFVRWMQELVYLYESEGLWPALRARNKKDALVRILSSALSKRCFGLQLNVAQPERKLEDIKRRIRTILASMKSRSTRSFGVGDGESPSLQYDSENTSLLVAALAEADVLLVLSKGAIPDDKIAYVTESDLDAAQRRIVDKFRKPSMRGNIPGGDIQAVLQSEHCMLFDKLELTQ